MKLAAVAIAIVLFASRSTAAAPGDRWDGGTLADAALGDGIGLTVGGLSGLGVGLVVGLATFDGRPDLIPVALVAGLGVGTFVGGVVGTKLGGDHDGGTGTWTGTSLATVVALGVSTGLIYVTRNTETPYKAVLLASVILVFAAPVIGYELSSDRTAPTPKIVAPLAFGFAF